MQFKSRREISLIKAVDEKEQIKQGRVEVLDYFTLGAGRGKSEGVGEKLIFIKGWNQGRHSEVESKTHSQKRRNLWGGRKLSSSGQWFGPRRVTRELEGMEKDLSQTERKRYGELLQEAAKFISKEELKGIQDFWTKRNTELEEDIFGLYNGGNGGADIFGKKKGKELIDLEFELEHVKDVFTKSEEEFRDNEGSYGAWVQNPRIGLVRMLGSVEGTAFNYLKKIAGPNAEKVKKLPEKNIALAVGAFILGKEIGFDCKEGELEMKNKYFRECNEKVNGVEIRKVIKSTWKNQNKYWVPDKDKGNTWTEQIEIERNDEKKLMNMDLIESSGILNEKCEETGLLDFVGDRGKEI